MRKRINLKKSLNILSIFITLILILSISGCSPKDKKGEIEKSINTQKTTYPLTIKDSYNREITLDKEPEKVISIAPNITETIFALGKGDKLVGRTDFCDYPSEVKNTTSIGSLQNPNIEKITELKPDLIIASTHFKKDVLEKLEALGMKIVVFYGEENFDGVYKTIENVGLTLNAKNKADDIISNMQKKVADVETKVKGKSMPSVYYILGYGKGGDFTAGKDTFVGKMITLAGGKNAAEDASGWKYSIEKLLEKNPDILICSKYFNAKNDIKNTNGYKDLNAVKNDKLYEIDNNILDRQGPRIADGLYELAKIIHPELFK